MRWTLHVFIFVLTAVLMISRRPDVLWNAQFHAEDAQYFAAAYNNGWAHALLFPYAGYLVIFERIAGALALIPPLRFAPLLMNLMGLTVQVLPVNFLLSSRCANWGNFSTRAILAAGYIALPSCSEINVMVTNAQWHLALMSCLVLLAAPSNKFWWRSFDVSVVSLSGLTGPYCLMLVPVALILAWRRRRKLSLTPLYAALAVTVIMQMTVMGVLAATDAPPGMGGRISLPIGASPQLFVKIVGSQVFLNAIAGGNHLATHPQPQYFALSALSAFAGATVIVYTLFKAQLEIKLFVLFSLLVFALSLKSPLMRLNAPQWSVLAGESGCRYYFFPMLAFVWSLIWCATSKSRSYLRVLAAVPLVILCIKLPKTWRYPLNTDLHLGGYYKQFEGAKPGTVVRLPIYPGGDWVIFLKKH